jgi:hypothetical protein
MADTQVKDETVLAAIDGNERIYCVDDPTGTPLDRYFTPDMQAAYAQGKGRTNAQTGTTYTLVAGDAGKRVKLTNAAAITLTLPNSLAADFTCMVEQGGAGQVTFSAAGGATLHNRQSHTKVAGQYGQVGVYVDENSGGSSAVYTISGDTAT